MAWSRYEAADAYVLEELRREYEAADAKGRILLLKKLKKDGIPFEIAALAAQDANVQVREWVARCGDFFSVLAEPKPWKDGRDWSQRMHETRDVLVEALKSDPDPFVRACLRENPAVFSTISSGWKPYFLEATHLERLALMRNPTVGETLVQQIFNPEDTELGIDMEERRELCLAFLSNKAKLHKLTDDAGLCPDHKGYWEARIDAERCLRNLWELAARWPEDMNIPFLVFQEVPANGLSFLDKQGSLKYVKAEIYRAHPQFRLSILFSCDGRPDDEVIRLGLEDPNEMCREIAYSKLSWVAPGWVEELIRRKDRVALEGLVQNQSLSVEDLGRIQGCLNEIKPGGFQHADVTTERKQRATISRDPERLFGKDGRGLLEEKINYVGQALAEAVRSEGELSKELRKQRKALLRAQVAGFLGVLLLLYLIFR